MHASEAYGFTVVKIRPFSLLTMPRWSNLFMMSSYFAR